MNKLAVAIAAATCLFLSTAAQATQFKLDFTVSSFDNGINPFEHAPIKGSILFTAASMGAAVTAIDAVDLVIDNHVYTASEIGADMWGDAYAFGGKLAPIGSVDPGTDNFALSINSVRNSFEFATAGTEGLNFGSNIVGAFSEVGAAGDVPEPGSLALLLAGAGGLGLLRRQRR
jgi:hypothetical protein